MTAPFVEDTIRAGDVSVVICAYTLDRWDDLVAAVTSVTSQQPPPSQLVLAIDHNDQLFARCEQAFPAAQVVANRGARGLSGARNAGIEACTGAVVAFLDDDAAARPGWVAALAAGYRDARVAGVGGAIVPRWRSRRPAWWPAEFDWVVGCSYTGLPTALSPVRNLIGANMSLRRSVFAQVGGFSEGIGRVGTKPLGCEETELCIRIRQRWPEAEILYVPEAVVDHNVGAARATGAYFRSRCYSEGLSKAAVKARVGRDDGLSSERAYVTRTLPAGIGRAMRHAAFAEAAAIVGGVAWAAAGYVAGSVAQVSRARSASTTGHRPAVDNGAQNRCVHVGGPLLVTNR